MSAPALDLRRLRPGFSDPVLDAQRCFRGLIEAMARPGRIIELCGLPEPPPGLGAAQVAILLALADQDTPVWIAPGLRNAEAGHYLRFHCRCRLSANAGEATFVVLSSFAGLPSFDALRLGDPEYPDRSATLIVEVDDLGRGERLRLRGPGIEHEAMLEVAGWTSAASECLRENERRLPLGVDLLLTNGARVAGLPRTVRLAGEG